MYIFIFIKWFITEKCFLCFHLSFYKKKDAGANLRVVRGEKLRDDSVMFCEKILQRERERG